MKVIFTFKFFALLVAVAVVTSAIGGCAGSAGTVPVVPGDEKWASQRWPGTTIGDLSRGHDVFVSRCSSCHGLPRPELKSPDEWDHVLDEMAARAKLSAADSTLVNRYLSATSQRLRSSAAVTRTESGKSSL